MTDIKLPTDATLGMSDAERRDFDDVSRTMIKHLDQLDVLNNTHTAPEVIKEIPALGLLSLRLAMQAENVVTIDFARRKRLQ